MLSVVISLVIWVAITYCFVSGMTKLLERKMPTFLMSTCAHNLIALSCIAFFLIGLYCTLFYLQFLYSVG